MVKSASLVLTLENGQEVQMAVSVYPEQDRNAKGIPYDGKGGKFLVTPTNIVPIHTTDGLLKATLSFLRYPVTARATVQRRSATAPAAPAPSGNGAGEEAPAWAQALLASIANAGKTPVAAGPARRGRPRSK